MYDTVIIALVCRLVCRLVFFLAFLRNGTSPPGHTMGMLIDNDAHVTVLVTYAHMIIMTPSIVLKHYSHQSGGGSSPLPSRRSVQCQPCLRLNHNFIRRFRMLMYFSHFINSRWITQTSWNLGCFSGKFFKNLSKRLNWVKDIRLLYFFFYPFWPKNDQNSRLVSFLTVLG